jgi:hypothetical protein
MNTTLYIDYLLLILTDKYTHPHTRRDAEAQMDGELREVGFIQVNDAEAQRIVNAQWAIDHDNDAYWGLSN